MDVSDAQDTRFEALLREGQLVNHYQPILDLRSGRVVGVETLARLRDGSNVVLPGAFLPGLEQASLDALLFASLEQGLSTLARCGRSRPDLFISFNVSPNVMIRDGFIGDFLRVLARAKVDPTRIMLEVLETDEFLHLSVARDRLEALDSVGVRIALDDVGSGYSSLARLRDLPVETIKLDQSFVRGLEAHPENMHFVSAMLSLARGLGKHLIVEGVETPDIMDGLRVLGAEAAQGHQIARPMPQDALLAWLQAHEPGPGDRAPRTLLGAFAAHIGLLEACHVLRDQPMALAWSKELRDPHACSVGRFLDDNGLHETAYGNAHKRFHAAIDQFPADPALWEETSDALLQSLKRAITLRSDRQIKVPADFRERRAFDRQPPLQASGARQGRPKALRDA